MPSNRRPLGADCRTPIEHPANGVLIKNNAESVRLNVKSRPFIGGVLLCPTREQCASVERTTRIRRAICSKTTGGTDAFHYTNRQTGLINARTKRINNGGTFSTSVCRSGRVLFVRNVIRLTVEMSPVRILFFFFFRYKIILFFFFLVITRDVISDQIESTDRPHRGPIERALPERRRYVRGNRLCMETVARDRGDLSRELNERSTRRCGQTN